MGNATPKLLLGGVGAARLGVDVAAEFGVDCLDEKDLLGVEFGVACRCEREEKGNRGKRMMSGGPFGSS